MLTPTARRTRTRSPGRTWNERSMSSCTSGLREAVVRASRHHLRGIDIVVPKAGACARAAAVSSRYPPTYTAETSPDHGRGRRNQPGPVTSTVPAAPWACAC